MSSRADQLPLAITMGEPAGIGPELVTRIWHKRFELNLPPFVYVGATEALFRYDSSIKIQPINNPTRLIECSENTLPVIEVATPAPIIPGSLDTVNGPAVIKSIDTAVDLALKGHVSGLVTSPIHKAGLYSAGFDAPGHTEYLARLCGLADDQSVMMLSTTGLRVVPVTAHVPLKDVTCVLTADKIVHAGIVTAHDLCTRFGINRPSLAIAGLNPHAGEGGTIGMAEATHIDRKSAG